MNLILFSYASFSWDCKNCGLVNRFDTYKVKDLLEGEIKQLRCDRCSQKTKGKVLLKQFPLYALRELRDYRYKRWLERQKEKQQKYIRDLKRKYKKKKRRKP